jgi:AraC-like DNA-binding protein
MNSDDSLGRKARQTESSLVAAGTTKSIPAGWIELVDLESHRTTLAVQAAEILDDIRREIGRSPEEARRAVLRLSELLIQRSTADRPGNRGGLAPWQARKIDQYFRTHLSEEMRVREMARHVQLSVSHFCRAFKETFGQTPHAYLVRLRLELAQTLMLSTRDPLTQIALECGFADLSHLSKAFRRDRGEAPSAWRRRNLIDPQARPKEVGCEARIAAFSGNNWQKKKSTTKGIEVKT